MSKTFELLKLQLKFLPSQDTLTPSYKLVQPVLLTDTQHEVSMLSRYSLQALLSYLDNFYAAAKSLGYSDEYVCEQLDRIPVNRYGVKYAMVVPFGSPFREIFDHKLVHMQISCDLWCA